MIRSMLRGFGRVFGSPGLILAAWLLTLIAALPATVGLGHGLHRSFGRTLAAERMAGGFDTAWFGEFQQDARGYERTFDPTIAGVGGVLANVEAWIGNPSVRVSAGLIALAAVFVLAWAVFLGGALERYAFADARRGIAATFAAGGRYWMRFVRLACLSAGVYYGVYRLHQWVMDRVEAGLLDTTEETQALRATLAVYAGTALLLVVVRACFDYAKIAIVVEDRKSALISAIQGVAFVATHPLSSIGLVLSMALVSAVPLTAYLAFRPSVATPGWGGVILALVAGQAWIVARLVLRLALIAGQVSLYQTASASPTSSASRGK